MLYVHYSWQDIVPADEQATLSNLIDDDEEQQSWLDIRCCYFLTTGLLPVLAFWADRLKRSSLIDKECTRFEVNPSKGGPRWNVLPTNVSALPWWCLPPVSPLKCYNLSEQLAWARRPGLLFLGVGIWSVWRLKESRFLRSYGLISDTILYPWPYSTGILPM